MSLELKINSPKLASESHPEMKIDVNFESSDPNKQLIVKPAQESISQVGGVKVTQTIGEVVQVDKPAGIAGKIKASWEKIQKSIKARKELAEKEMRTREEAKKLVLKEQQDKKLAQHAAQGIEITQPSEQSSKKQKKNKNKKRH
jgi:hypothetical protein